MRTDAAGKSVIKLPSAEQQENVKNTRKTLKVLQHTATDKENLVGRGLRSGKDIFIKAQSDSETIDAKKKKTSNKSVQTGSGLTIDISDLTSEAGPSQNYWEVIAERRRIALDESLDENRKLHDENGALREENRVCKEMLDESKNLVEVLTEMLAENEGSNNDKQDDDEEKKDNEDKSDEEKIIE